MQQWLEKLKANRQVAHLLRMQERFTARLGNQFAAAVTYFSVLSIVPVLMFAFSLLGMVLTVFRPDLMNQVGQLITGQFQDNPIGTQILGLMKNALANWAAVGIVALVIFAYSGATWVANLKSAIRAQMRPDFSEGEKKSNIVVETLTNLGILLVLLVTILLMFTVTAAVTGFSQQVVDFLHLPQGPLTGALLYVAPIPVSIAMGFVLFAFLYRVSYQQRIPRRVLFKGALTGAVGLAALQYLTSFITSLFAGNAAAQVFGPIILVMLFFNLFATLILMIAAWMATFQQQPVYRSPIAKDVGDAPAQMAEPVPMVREAVAQQAMKVGMGTGYVLGAATGVGLGAMVAGVIGWFARLRRP